jgi:hypothetical protein
MLDPGRGGLAILAALAAFAAAGCGGASDDSSASGGTAAPAGVSKSKEELPTGGAASGDPDCQSKKDPETGRYLPTPEKCHLEAGDSNGGG